MLARITLPESFFRFGLTRYSALALMSIAALSLVPAPALAHGGHGDEFHDQTQATPSATQIQVDPATATRIGLKVEPVTSRPFALGIKATGQIETLPDQQVEVTTPVGGTVIQLLVKPGERVHVGQPVALMSSPELAQIRTEALDRASEAIAAVQQAQTDLRLAQQNYDQQIKITKADLNQAQVALDLAQERHSRDQELLARGAIPRQQLLESASRLAEAKALLAKVGSQLQVFEAQAQIKRAESALQIAQSKVRLSDKTYQTRLKQLGASPNANGIITLKAPITGVVTDREVTLGQSSQDAGLKVMTLLNGRRVLVAANIFEKDLSRIKVGQAVRIQVNGLPNRTFSGRISVIGTVVNPETRIIPVKAELDNADNVLKPGMFAELEVLMSQSAPVLAIPTTAVLETHDKKQIVFVQNGNAYEPVEVTLGQVVAGFVAVKDGLFDGDMIVTQRANQLYAQSLKGGSPSPAESEKSVVSQVKATSGNEEMMDFVNSKRPWWGIVAAGGVILVGTFWIGRHSAKPKKANPTSL